ncbi:hypothetical protein [Zeimonas arvi]|uniref:Uncharacterized protein n=1 Tax=Zeimonas arvi TaxID=2498847 RepID=A0A5C8NSK0_9BURK|nr:hypothetical protein [Zeimonas arvi]TXL63911.1 hypothetical protein FHP08_16600 [Zeimonas arvi]
MRNAAWRMLRWIRANRMPTGLVIVEGGDVALVPDGEACFAVKGEGKMADGTASRGRPVWRILKWIIFALVAWVLVLIAAGNEIDSKVPALLPMRSVFTDIWDGGYASAEGTWTIEGAKSASPFQTSSVTCRRREGLCKEARAKLVNDNDYLVAEMEEYRIQKWDEHTIVFTTESATCARYTYTLDRASKALVGVRTLKAPDDPRCAQLEDRLVLRLEDGLEVHRRARAEAMPWWGEIAYAPLRALFR